MVCPLGRRSNPGSSVVAVGSVWSGWVSIGGSLDEVRPSAELDKPSLSMGAGFVSVAESTGERSGEEAVFLIMAAVTSST